jgi:signal transduction histidine kinase/ActR/RegA family two-component response regulator/HPt (histidine-containing phosphotransfer) domain-containing protein
MLGEVMSAPDRDLRVLHVALGRERRLTRAVLREVVSEKRIEGLDFERARERLASRASYDVILFDADGDARRIEDAFVALFQRAAAVPIVVVTDDEGPTFAAGLVTLGAADVLAARALDARTLGRTLVIAAARNRALQAVMTSRDEALRASRATGDFLANVSHEIRAPLNTVLGMADLLAETALPERSATQLAALRRAGAHVLALADDLLDLARVESGSLAIQKEPFDPARVARGALEFFSTTARDKNLALRLECAPELPAVVTGDARRLRQVLVNLIGNAVKFTESGAVSLTLARSPGRPDEMQFGVHDTGIGIPADKVDEVFASYVQGDESIAKRYGGAGLGLHIAKQLVGAMGGSIEVHSELGRGSDFVVKLPLPDAQGAAKRTDSSQPPRARTETGPLRAGARAMRVLLVDDDYESRALVAEYLRESDIALAFAADGPTALASLSASRVDVVLMDLHLPLMDGFATTTAIRKMERENGMRAVPIIALSADALAESVKRALAAGCVQHLSKPISKAALVEALAMQTGPSSSRVESTPGPAPGSHAAALFPKFLDNRVKDVGRCREALASGDFETIARLGHNMRGNGASYGLPVVSAIGAELEEAAHAANHAAIHDALDALQSHLAEVAPPVADPAVAPRNGSGIRPRIDERSRTSPRGKRSRG